MDYRTKKQLALIWLKVKLLGLLLICWAGISFGAYALTEWNAWLCIAIGGIVNAVGFWLEDHPGSEQDREVLKYPVSGITGSRYPKKHL